ncbi:excisionase family DNA-binding protein [Yoonia vestfoldensis]|uniref:excisionase family DNA-binding protein n=1 Tax=Yoonia vestfoldensis TaxID=245188 RepID=UPI003B58D2F4
MLAKRWECSAETVRQMIRDGRLPAFRVGRMMRVTQQVVEQYECGTIGSGGLRAASSSCGTNQTARGDVIALRLTQQRKRSEKRAT